MSETPTHNPDHKPKSLAEMIETHAQVECPLDEIDFLKKMFAAGKELVFSYNPGTHSLKVWYRENDGDYRKDHSTVDLDASMYGYTGFVSRRKQDFRCFRPSPARDLEEWDTEKSIIRKKIIEFLT